MSLRTQIEALATRIASEFNTHKAKLVPGGGAAGQVLQKATSSSNDVSWATPVTSADVSTAVATKQPLDPLLTSIAGLTTAANQIVYLTGTDAAAVATITAWARTILDDVDAATARGTLGAQAADATLTALAGLSTAADQVVMSTGTDTFAMVPLTSFARTILDDVDAAAVRATIGAQVAGSYQPAGSYQAAGSYQTASALLGALAGLTTAANQFIYATGSNAFAMGTVTAWARTLMDDADAATARGTLGAQAASATLTGVANATTNAANLLLYTTAADVFASTALSTFARTILDDADAATMRSTLGLGTAATRNISTGTAAPSGGANGDIYFQFT